MNGSKDWYKSKTIWAALVTVVVGTLAMGGVGALEGEEDNITELIMQGVTIVAGVVALIGRIQAGGLKGPSNGSAILLLACLLFVGCGFPAEYRSLIDEAATVATVRDADCQAGNDEECRANSRYATETLQALRDAAWGRVVE